VQRVLVTGGAGYLGSLLTYELLSMGYHVTIFDRLTWGVNSILPMVSNKNLEVVKADVRDAEKVSNFIAKNDITVNLAAIVGYPACDANPWEAMSVNVDSVRSMVSELSTDQLFIQASTGSSYGKVSEICTEETPINPLTLYGRTKSEAEKVTLEKSAISLRFATVYGISPRMRLDLFINDLVNFTLKQGFYVMYEANASRTFLHAKDAVASILFAVTHSQEMKGQVFNVGDAAQNYTKLQVATLLQEKVEFLLHLAEVGSDRDQRDYDVSYEKISALGYEAQHSLDSGLEELVKLFKVMEENSVYRNV